MEVFYQFLRHLLSAASSFYIFSAAVLLTHCMCDGGVAWNPKKKWLLLGVVTLDEAINIFWEISGAAGFLVLFCYLLVFAYGCGQKHIRRAIKVFGVFLYILSSFAMISDIGYYYMFHGYFVPEKYEFWYEIILLPVCVFLYYYLSQKFIKKGLVIPFGRREKWLLAFYFVYIFSFFGMIVVSEGEGKWMEGILQVLVEIVMMVFTLGFPVYIFKTRISAYYRDMKDYQEEFLQAELSYFRQYKESQEETRRFRHDIKNHLMFLDAMMGEHKEREAQEYLGNLLQKVQKLSPEIVTGDEMLDCIFSFKTALMRQEQISFEMEGVLDGGLGWKPMDICCVFANALDNAIEACMRIPEEQPREIHVSLKKTEQFFYIEISNTVSSDEEGKKIFSSGENFTSKKNRNLHGFGILNMRRTVEKYGGILNMECRDKRVTLSLILRRGDQF